ncbi:hypothetical protein [Phytomonospora endophytica]|uniref:Uncharacterized protein n=1 Tax=Phytomonospora endophytica TaxID=714109 RepID=A0A841FLK9_9ACTN|nr:hypothetical protein [Phytomonospora endophytica]MBB6038211.1 hypothetical protein [Phytomonospora endophytica]GIG67331.1 hypothetical protein Pen01_36260 [Phytomonospora endophytica]
MLPERNGVIADGVVWDDGEAVLRWRGDTTGVRQSEDFRHWTQIDTVHGHHGTTHIAWLDDPPVVSS